MSKKKTEVKRMEEKKEVKKEAEKKEPKKMGKKQFEFDVVQTSITAFRVEAWSAGHAAELFNEGKAQKVGEPEITKSKVKRARLVG